MGTAGRLGEGKWKGGQVSKEGEEQGGLAFIEGKQYMSFREMWFSCMGTSIFTICISVSELTYVCHCSTSDPRTGFFPFQACGKIGLFVGN